MPDPFSSPCHFVHGLPPMIHARPWNGKDLTGDWEFTLKIDGVRALWVDSGWVSRAGKPLYNIPDPIQYRNGKPPKPTDCEVYCSKPGRSSKENYRATIQCVRAATKDRPIYSTELYSLDPLDARLRAGTYLSPTAAFIKSEMEDAVHRGYEGLVLRQGDKWLKVKPVETHDVPIEKIIEGNPGGKHEGRMGAVMTPMGKVGTGFSDFEREAIWADRIAHIGVTIEVSCMQLTPDGKFRHPRFERFRYDK